MDKSKSPKDKVVTVTYVAADGQWKEISSPACSIAALLRDHFTEYGFALIELKLVTMDGMVIWSGLGAAKRIGLADVEEFFAQAGPYVSPQLERGGKFL